MNTRRKFILQSGLAATALIAAKPFKSVASVNQLMPSLEGGNTITILHTNDISNCLDPLNRSGYEGLGGFNQTAAVIRSIRNESNPVLLLDAGNTFSGNIHHREAHSQTLRLMGQLRYDAMIPGHHDFKEGVDFLNEQLSAHRTPVVLSNYHIHHSEFRSRITNYRITRKGNIKIGIIGAGAPIDNAAITYKNAVKETSALADELRNQHHCDLIVCISHLGYKNNKSIDDITLASESNNIDVIIGGHSREFMRRPSIVMNKNKQEVIINHAGHSGILLGKMEISFDENRRKNNVSFKNLMIGTQDHKWKQFTA